MHQRHRRRPAVPRLLVNTRAAVHTLRHSCTLSLMHTLRHPCAHSDTRVHTQTLMHTLRHPCAHSDTCAHSQTPVRTLRHPCAHSDTRTHADSHAHTRTLVHTLRHSCTRSDTRAHTQTLMHTLRHSWTQQVTPLSGPGSESPQLSTGRSPAFRQNEGCCGHPALSLCSCPPPGGLPEQLRMEKSRTTHRPWVVRTQIKGVSPMSLDPCMTPHTEKP